MDWLTPGDPAELAGLLAGRAGEPGALLPTGAGEPPPALADAAGPADGGGLDGDASAVSTASLAGVHDLRPRDLTVEAGAGARVADLLRSLAAEGVWIPLGGLAPGMSVGGLTAAAPAGPFDDSFGDLKRQLLACGLVAWDGEALRWGRAVMKNVAGYSMVRSVAGSFGRTGVVHRATFRLWPAPEVLSAPELVPGAGEAGPADRLALAGTLAVSDVDASVRPDAAVWSWSPGSPDGGRTEIRLVGSEASVALRRDRLEGWAAERDAEVAGGEPAAFDPLAAAGGRDRGERLPGLAAAGPDRDPGVSVVAIRTGRAGFEAAARRALRALEGAAVALEGYPLVGHLRCAYRRGAAPEAAGAEAGAANRGPGSVEGGPRAPVAFRGLLEAVGDAAVRVERGSAAELEAADARRADGARRLEARVLEQLGGRARHWLSAYL